MLLLAVFLPEASSLESLGLARRGIAFSEVPRREQVSFACLLHRLCQEQRACQQTEANVLPGKEKRKLAASNCVQQQKRKLVSGDQIGAIHTRIAELKRFRSRRSNRGSSDPSERGY